MVSNVGGGFSDVENLLMLSSSLCLDRLSTLGPYPSPSEHLLLTDPPS